MRGFRWYRCMDFRRDLQVLWNSIGVELYAWYDLYMMSANAQIGFQRGHPDFARFVVVSFLSIFLEGERA